MEISKLAVPLVYALIGFLAYSSQWLLPSLEPRTITRRELLEFNALLICLLITYTRSVFVDPGHIPPQSEKEIGEEGNPDNSARSSPPQRKWCRKCNAPKPPRAHHCRECKRCIPKMDHHCPWTQNCVSQPTFPHFLRFLFYAVASMLYLTSLLWPHISHLWTNRNLPSYLGPTMPQLAHLFLLTVGNSLTLFALSILLIRNIWALVVNTTTIEGWEIERHDTLVRRARYFGGVLEAPNGTQVRIRKQEFPYDVGFWRNCKEGMGTGNILAWFNPLSSTPKLPTPLTYPTNDFESPALTWPPPDPDRLHRYSQPDNDKPTLLEANLSASETLAAFQKRQADDIRRRKPFVQRIEEQQRRVASILEEDEDAFGSDAEEEYVANKGRDENEGEEAWRNSEGERLRDFGVDEDVEFYDEEDDLPLSELLARRKARASGHGEQVSDGQW
ncbi:zf-DHHC-domain-containing protein [Sporormia fimetaria CBS 119925]|uniref:Palmitoyltransferase PFA4 n=1 Tax=Sporormia fimetaria CBS 119925 TaxID=1340428 RepID=A0A6A6VJP4_9PLEO|nr:zf-DHHC-domain-containing protein [Sporormia fimetaria CBS 119925]